MGTITDKLNKLAETKSAIKTAIVNKGVAVSDSDTFASYASKIDAISGGGGGFVIPNGVKLGYSRVIPDNIDTSNVTDMSDMFAYSELYTIPLIDTSNVTNMSYMFEYCNNLTTIPLLNTSKVTNMRNMFTYSGLHNIPLIDTSKVTNMRSMFQTCFNLDNIPLIDTSNVINMESMFYNCRRLTTIPQLDVSKVTTMAGMFTDCENLAYLKLINLGASQQFTAISLSNCTLLGDDTKVAGARQALIDTFITYSYDRATAGYSACKIYLSTNTKALLTQDEIAQITAKGYTLA